MLLLLAKVTLSGAAFRGSLHICPHPEAMDHRRIKSQPKQFTHLTTAIDSISILDSIPTQFVMQDITSMIWRKLRALCGCQQDELPTWNAPGIQTTSATECPAERTFAVQAFPQAYIPLPADISLPKPPTLDGHSRQDAVAEPDERWLHSSQALSCTANDGGVRTGQIHPAGDTEPNVQGTHEDDSHAGHEEHPIVLTPEQAQAVREANYFVFEGEDETDYTRGPARMVEATDGVDDCTALLMTLDLSQAMQEAINAQRDFLKAKAAATEKVAALLRFDATIEAQISSHRSHLTMPDLDPTKKSSLQTELSNLELMAEEYKLERTAVENNLQFEGEMLRRIQARVNAVLEEALIDAQLLAPEAEEHEEFLPEYDLQTEYQSFKEKLRAVDDPLLEDGAPLNTNNDHMKIPMTSEEREKHEEAERLQQDLYDAMDWLEAAQAEFDGRDFVRERAEQARDATIRAGYDPEDATTEIFDLRWIAHERQLTRELVEAEEAFRTAQEAVQDDKVFEDCVGADEMSQVGDYVDGYVDEDCCSASEDEIIASAPVARISRWISELPDDLEEFTDPFTFDRLGLGDEDEWDAASLRMGDSISVFIDRDYAASQNPYKAELAKWKKMQEEAAVEFAWMKKGGGVVLVG